MKLKSINKLVLNCIVLLLFSFGFSASTYKTNSKICYKGNYSYSPADYKDAVFMKEEYGILFDSLLQEQTYDCFCQNKIKNLPANYRGSEKTILNRRAIFAHKSIEPFFVNQKNNDGLYGYREWYLKGRNPRSVYGYRHFLFLIADNSYISLTHDSTKNVNLTKENLSKSFTKEELQTILTWNIRDNVFWNNYTFVWPQLIKNDTTILWDIKKEILKKSSEK